MNARLTERMRTLSPPAPVMDSLLRVRRALAGARRLLGTPDADIIERTLAAGEIRALGIAAELDVARLLAGRPRTTEELAGVTDTDAGSLDRVLTLLAATGCFRQDRARRWRNTRVSAALSDDHPVSMRSWARFFAGAAMFETWAAADHSVRTGEASTPAAFFEWLQHDRPELGHQFDEAMREGSRFLGPAIATAAALDGVGVVCDVGGGTGGTLAGILRDRPGLHGILFDLPEVVARAIPVVTAAGLGDRVEIVGGSFFDAVPQGADRYLLVSVVHDWDDQHATSILTRCRDALGPGGRVLVVEQVLRPGKPTFLSHHTNVLMLVCAGGAYERTREGFEQLFRGAGLRSVRVAGIGPVHTCFELERAG